MAKVIFIIPSLSDSHCKNRIVEFQSRGHEVLVYGFLRAGQKNPNNLPYDYKVIGELHDESYLERIKLYLREFKRIWNSNKNDDVIFYLNGLDIAMFFHYVNPKARYIYEQRDLTHTYLGRLKGLLEYFDKRVIKHSLLTVTTSEGFINFHFKGKKPENVVLVENKLNPEIVKIPVKDRKVFDKEHISIGFVGGPRFDSVYNFINVFCRNFPNGVFHVYGGPVAEQFEQLKKNENCIFHGFFSNPTDLPSIYESIDLVVATYDTKFENVKYAEPNKIYESIYFETPIVVSSGTFLADKVGRLGIGYSIDAMDDNAIISFVNSLTNEGLMEKSENAHKIDKKEVLNINDSLFNRVEEVWHK